MRTYAGHTGFIEALAFSPDGKMLASGGADRGVRFWDVVNGKPLPALRITAKDQVGALAFSADGRWLAVGDYSGHVRAALVDDPANALEWEGQGRIVSIGFAPSGEWLSWASYSGSVLCQYLDEGTLTPLGKQETKTFCLSVSPDGSTVAIGYQSAAFALWDVQSRKRQMFEHGKKQGCWEIAYAPSGRAVALALGDGVQLWDVVEGRMVTELGGHKDVVSGVAYSADGRRLATCGWDQTVNVYEVDNGLSPCLIESYDWKIGRLYKIAFSPDGTLAAVGGDRADYVLAWDVD